MIKQYISVISVFPKKIRKAVEGLNDGQLDTPYRPGGWTIRQVVHHCADSHMNSLIRLKLALTEDKPTIKPYFEDRWAELADSRTLPVAPALLMLEGIHSRWTYLLENLSREQFGRTFFHPETGKEVRLDANVALYAWHCEHHLAHIVNLRREMGWESI